MAISFNNLLSKNQTGHEMYKIVERYHGDLDSLFVNYSGKLVPISSLPLNRFFDFVKNIPYRRDTRPIEVIARPKKIIENRQLGMDCKKKSILMASYLSRRGVPYRFIASSRLPSKAVHHVFPQINLFGFWLNADATYSDYNLFQPKKITYSEVL